MFIPLLLVAAQADTVDVAAPRDPSIQCMADMSHQLASRPEPASQLAAYIAERCSEKIVMPSCEDDPAVKMIDKRTTDLTMMHIRSEAWERCGDRHNMQRQSSMRILQDGAYQLITSNRP